MLCPVVEALTDKVFIELRHRGCFRYRNEEVPSCVAYQVFNETFLVTAGRVAEICTKHIVSSEVLVILLRTSV